MRLILSVLRSIKVIISPLQYLSIALSSNVLLLKLPPNQWLRKCNFRVDYILNGLALFSVTARTESNKWNHQQMFRYHCASYICTDCFHPRKIRIITPSSISNRFRLLLSVHCTIAELGNNEQLHI